MNFPPDWYNFLHPPDSAPDQTLAINLTQERFPFRYRGKKIQIYQVDVFLKFRDIHSRTVDAELHHHSYLSTPVTAPPFGR